MNNSKILGMSIGLIIGIVLVWLGPWEAFIAGLFALGGWLVGKYLSGEIPAIDVILENVITRWTRRPRQ